MSQQRGDQRGKQEEQNLRQNEAYFGILENRDGRAGRLWGGGLKGKWKVQGSRAALSDAGAEPSRGIAASENLSVPLFLFTSPRLPLTGKKKTQKSQTNRKKGEIMTRKAGKLMASNRVKHCHGPELHPVISEWPRCQKG